MVTRLSLVRVVATNHVFLVLRVLSDVPGQSAGDLVDGLTKAEEEVSFIINFISNSQAKQMMKYALLRVARMPTTLATQAMQLLNPGTGEPSALWVTSVSKGLEGGITTNSETESIATLSFQKPRMLLFVSNYSLRTNEWFQRLPLQ